MVATWPRPQPTLSKASPLIARPKKRTLFPRLRTKNGVPGRVTMTVRGNCVSSPRSICGLGRHMLSPWRTGRIAVALSFKNILSSIPHLPRSSTPSCGPSRRFRSILNRHACFPMTRSRAHRWPFSSILNRNNSTSSRLFKPFQRLMHVFLPTIPKSKLNWEMQTPRCRWIHACLRMVVETWMVVDSPSIVYRQC